MLAAGIMLAAGVGTVSDRDGHVCLPLCPPATCSTPCGSRAGSQEALPYGFIHDWQVCFCRIVQMLRQVWRLEIGMTDDAVFESSRPEDAAAGRRAAVPHGPTACPRSARCRR